MRNFYRILTALILLVFAGALCMILTTGSAPTTSTLTVTTTARPTIAPTFTAQPTATATEAPTVAPLPSMTAAATATLTSIPLTAAIPPTGTETVPVPTVAPTSIPYDCSKDDDDGRWDYNDLCERFPRLKPCRWMH